MAELQTLREEQTQVTRSRILDALVELVSEGRAHDFSVQEVADRAGVSHRTVYRHFADKAALLDGLAHWLEDEMMLRVGTFRRGDLIDGMGPTWRMFEELAPMVEALVMLSVGGGISIRRRQERTEEFREFLKDALEHLTPADADAVMGVIRIISSSTAWFIMRREAGAEPAAAISAVEWATAALLRDLRAGGGPGRSDSTHRAMSPVSEADEGEHP